MTNLQERMRALRKEQNLKQEDVLETFGVSIRTYRRYEAGEQEPTASVLRKMAEFYGVSVDYLMGLSDTRERQL